MSTLRVNTITDLAGVPFSTGASNPAGTVIAFAYSTAPTGYLKCNGASLSTTTYATLFTAIGYTFGGSGASFSVPDLRGEFVRGWDDARGIDTARTFGSAQADDFKSHQHTLNVTVPLRVADVDRGGGSSLFSVDNAVTPTTDFKGGTETRPRNIALLYCIKF